MLSETVFRSLVDYLSPFWRLAVVLSETTLSFSCRLLDLLRSLDGASINRDS